MGHDQRIGFQFLFPGPGYGGSACFPKDVEAIIAMGRDTGLPLKLMQAVRCRERFAKAGSLSQKYGRIFQGELTGKTLAIWGLAFKPRTDDIREAPALTLIDQLLDAGARRSASTIRKALANVRELYGDKIYYADRPYGALGRSRWHRGRYRV